MPSYLSFLEGAAHALVEALQVHDAQVDRDDASRDSYALAKCIDLSHLAADRVLKHAIAKHDPYLLLSSPKAELLRNIRSAMMHYSASSMFAIKGMRVETLDAAILAEKVLRDVVYPNLDEAEHAAFLSALKAIVPLRNSVQHGELIGEGDELLSNVRSLLGEVYSLARIVCPEIEPLIRGLDVQANARLLAHKKALDAAWNVFVQHLREQGATEFPYSMDLTLPAEGEPGQLTMGNDSGGNHLDFQAEVPWPQFTGLFHRRHVGGRGRALQRALLAYFPLEEPEQIDLPQPGRTAPLEALLTPLPRKPLHPLESGSIRMNSALGRIFVRLSPRQGRTRRSLLSVPVLLSDWSFDLLKDRMEGVVTGLLVSAREGSGEAVVTVTGSIFLQGEYVHPEDTESTLFSPGTVSFRVYGTLTLALKEHTAQ